MKFVSAEWRIISADEFSAQLRLRILYFITVLSVLIYAFFVSSFDVNLYFYASPFIISKLKISTIYIGLSVSTFALGVIVSALIGGYAFNRISIKFLFLSAITLATLSSIMTGFASGTFELLLFRYIVGMGTGMLQGTIVGFIGMILPERKGYLLSLTGISFSIGLLAGPYCESVFSPLYVPSFLISGILGTICFFLLFTFIPNIKRGQPIYKTRGNMKIFTRNLNFVLLAVFFFGIGYFGFIGYFSRYLIDYLRLGNQLSATVVSMLGLGGITLTLPFGHLSDRFGRKILLIVLYSILAFTSFTIFFLRIPIIILIAMSFLFGAAYDSLIIVTAAAAQDYTENRGEGISSGLMYSFFYGGGIIGGYLFGVMLGKLGFKLSGVVAVTLFMLIGLIVSTLINEHKAA